MTVGDSQLSSGRQIRRQYTQSGTIVKKRQVSCKGKMMSFLDNPFYLGFLVLFNLIAILNSIFLDHYFEDQPLKLLKFWTRSCILVNTVYLLDLILNICFEGMNQIYEKKKWLLVELIQQLTCIYVYIKFFEGDIEEITRGSQVIMRVYFVRFIRISEFCTEFQ